MHEFCLIRDCTLPASCIAYYAQIENILRNNYLFCTALLRLADACRTDGKLQIREAFESIQLQ